MAKIISRVSGTLATNLQQIGLNAHCNLNIWSLLSGMAKHFCCQFFTHKAATTVTASAVILGSTTSVLAEDFTGTTMYMADGEFISVVCAPDEGGEAALTFQTAESEGTVYYDLTCANPARGDGLETLGAVGYTGSTLYLDHGNVIRVLCAEGQGGQAQLDWQDGWYSLGCSIPGA